VSERRGWSCGRKGAMSSLSPPLSPLNLSVSVSLPLPRSISPLYLSLSLALFRSLSHTQKHTPDGVDESVGSEREEGVVVRAEGRHKRVERTRVALLCRCLQVCVCVRVREGEGERESVCV
jgi:hypothetical protein